MEKSKLYRIYKLLIYVSIFSLYYILFFNQSLLRGGPLGNFAADTYNHIFGTADGINVAPVNSIHYLHQNWLDLFTKDYEPLLHILTALIAVLIHLISGNSEQMDLANSMAFILSTAKLAEFILVKKIIESHVDLKEMQVLLFTIIVNFSTVLYLPIINLNVYIPMMTPNLLHNPTMIVLTPLAIAFFYEYIKHRIKSDTVTIKQTALFSLLLVVTTLIKPAFTNVMLLVLGFYYLSHPKRFITKQLWHDCLIFLPSILIMIYQLYLIKEANYGTLAFSPFKVLSVYTQHPILTLLQAIEFPLLVTCVYFIKHKNDFSTYLGMTWLFVAVAYVIWAFFYLTGPRWAHGNLAWSYSLSLTFLYVFGIIAYIRIITQTAHRSIVQLIQPTILDRAYPVLVNVCTLNLGFIFLSGMNQFIKVYLGGSWL